MRGQWAIFVDIDGVLNTQPDPRLVKVEAALCARLQRLLAASEAELVLTTPWREHHAYLSHVLTSFGVAWASELHRTPRMANAKRKDLAILQWLRNRPAGEVRSWVALDTADLLCFPSAGRMAGHTIQVRPETGLSDADVDEALRLLKEGATPRYPEGSAAAACPRGVEPAGAASPTLAVGENLAAMMGQLSVALNENTAAGEGGAQVRAEAGASGQSEGPAAAARASAVAHAGEARPSLSTGDKLAALRAALNANVAPKPGDLEATPLTGGVGGVFTAPAGGASGHSEGIAALMGDLVAELRAAEQPPKAHAIGAECFPHADAEPALSAGGASVSKHRCSAAESAREFDAIYASLRAKYG